jgi:alkaline phosphatase D
VPLSIATGNARDPQRRTYRDGWANGTDDNPYGYERELIGIVEFMRTRGVKNVVFLTADQHFSNLFGYDPDGDGVADFHEANIGPLRAGLGRGAIDPTLKPSVLFSDQGKAAHAYGVLAIAADSGRLTIAIRGVDGKTVPGAVLELDPR